MTGELSLEQVQDQYPRHNIEEKIAGGGQKDVFKGEFDGQDIVLKPIVVETWEDAKRAELEIRAMKEIESPILVDLLQSFQDQIEEYELFVMVEEYIDGRDLAEYLNEEGANIELALELGDTILELLEEFDEKGYIHRDIKPKNIMVESSGGLRLLDVGIARSPEDTDITPTGRESAPGTPGYRAPEQMRNEQEKQDVRTDMFALGIVMFEVATLNHPFDNQEVAIDSAIEAGIHDELSDHISVPDQYTGLTEFINRLLEPKMYERYNNPRLARRVLGGIV